MNQDMNLKPKHREGLKLKSTGNNMNVAIASKRKTPQLKGGGH